MTTLRASAPSATFWTAAAVTAVLVLGALAEGSWRATAGALAPGALIVWACWVFLYRPVVRFDERVVVAVNLGRIVEIPWERVAAVRQRYQLIFDLDDGTSIACWGGPMSAKPAARRRTRGAASSAGIQTALEELRADAVRTAVLRGDAPAPVVRRWDVASLAIGALLVLAVALQFSL